MGERTLELTDDAKVAVDGHEIGAWGLSASGRHWFRPQGETQPALMRLDPKDFRVAVNHWLTTNEKVVRKLINGR